MENLVGDGNSMTLHHVSYKNGEGLPPIWRWLLLLGVVGGGAYVRFSGVITSFTGAGAGFLANLFSGVRLYMLPWWNLGDNIQQNFFKSIFYTYHGIANTLYPYLVVKVYGALSIPLTEWKLIASLTFCSVTTILLLYWLGTLLNGFATGLVAVMLLAFSPTNIALAQTGDRMSFVLLLQVASLIAYFEYASRRSRWWAAPAAIFMALQVGSENFYYSAIFLLLHFCIVFDPARALRTNLAAFGRAFFAWRNLLVWTPSVLVWGINVFVYARLWESNLGLLGQLLQYRSFQSPLSWSWAFLGRMYNWVNYQYPLYAVAFLIALVWQAKHVRSLILRGFTWLWSVLLLIMVLVGRAVKPINSVHLFVPSSLLIGMTLSDGLRLLARRIAPKHGPRRVLVVGLPLLGLALALFPTAYASRQ